MKIMLKKKTVFWILAIFVVFVSITGFIMMKVTDEPSLDSLDFAKMPVSEENKLMITLSDFKASIRRQKLEELDKIMDDDFAETSPGISFRKHDMKNHIDHLFKTRKKPIREQNQISFISNDLSITSAPLVTETSTSDFEMAIDSVKFSSDEGIAYCSLQLFGDLKNGKLEKDIKVKFKFRKKDGSWRMKESDKFYDFLK